MKYQVNGIDYLLNYFHINIGTMNTYIHTYIHIINLKSSPFLNTQEKYISYVQLFNNSLARTRSVSPLYSWNRAPITATSTSNPIAATADTFL